MQLSIPVEGKASVGPKDPSIGVFRLAVGITGGFCSPQAYPRFIEIITGPVWDNVRNGPTRGPAALSPAICLTDVVLIGGTAQAVWPQRLVLTRSVPDYPPVVPAVLVL
jgi:hypothetical protein